MVDKIATNYPPFVNYFELRIKKLNEYKRKYPLFQAFLKVIKIFAWIFVELYAFQMHSYMCIAIVK